MKNTLITLFFIWMFASCAVEKTLEENPSTIITTFSNYGLGPEYSWSYTLGLNFNNGSGTFTLNIPANYFSGSDRYQVSIELSEDDIINLNKIISEMKFRPCRSDYSIVNDAYKSVSFTYSDASYDIDTDNTCVYYSHDYFFTTSFSELFYYFKTIVSQQGGSSELPNGWESRI